MQWVLDGELIVGTVLACCRAWVFTLNYWYLNRWKNQLYLTLHDALLTVCLLRYHRRATPQRFPDDCVSVFDPEACEYVVHKKDEPTIRCPVFSAVLKWFVFYGVLEVWRWVFHINDAFHITFVPFFKMPVSRFRFLNKNSYETNSQSLFQLRHLNLQFHRQRSGNLSLTKQQTWELLKEKHIIIILWETFQVPLLYLSIY